MFPKPRILAWLLTVCGAVGLTSALLLTVEKIATLRNPEHVPTCSINPVLSCGSVMDTPQAELFGFPNPLLGVVGFTIVTTLGVVVLAGCTLPRWIYLGLQIGVSVAMIFVGWLIFQSLYRIAALCPYCMVVWVVVSIAFWYVTLFNLTSGHLPVSHTGAVSTLARLHSAVLAAWFLLVIFLIGQAFWDYWRTLLVLG